jgi:hypothetical protein
MLLDCSGAMSLLILLDNDDAGRLGSQQIYDKCYRTYNIKSINIPTNDVAEMSIDQIQNIILPEMDKIYA